MLTTALACGLGASLLGSGYSWNKSRLYKQEGLNIWNREKLASESVVDVASYEKRTDSYSPGQHLMIGFPARRRMRAYLIDIYERSVYQKIDRSVHPQIVPSWDIGRLADFAFADGDLAAAVLPNFNLQYQERVSVGVPQIIWNNIPKYSIFIHSDFDRLGITWSLPLDLSALPRQSLELKEEVISLGKDQLSELKSFCETPSVSLMPDEAYKRQVRLINSQSIYIWARHYPTGVKVDILDTDPVALAQRAFATERIENETARSWANFGIACGVLAATGFTVGLASK